MNEAAKEARRTYQREWQRKNRDKVKKYQQDYWNRKAQQAAESEAAAAQEDPAQHYLKRREKCSGRRAKKWHR